MYVRKKKESVTLNSPTHNIATILSSANVSHLQLTPGNCIIDRNITDVKIYGWVCPLFDIDFIKILLFMWMFQILNYFLDQISLDFYDWSASCFLGFRKEGWTDPE